MFSILKGSYTIDIGHGDANIIYLWYNLLLKLDIISPATPTMFASQQLVLYYSMAAQNRLYIAYRRRKKVANNDCRDFSTVQGRLRSRIYTITANKRYKSTISAKQMNTTTMIATSIHSKLYSKSAQSCNMQQLYGEK